MIYLAQWSDSTSWPNVSSINGGQEYTAADGIVFADFNKVVRALLWLKEYEGTGGGGTIENSRITTGYLSIAAGDLATSPIYNDAVSVLNNSGVILVSPADKSTSEICSEYLEGISYTGKAVRYTFRSNPAKTMSFRYVIIPTNEGSVVPVFDACWSKVTANARYSYVVTIGDNTADKTAQEIFEMVQAGVNVAALRNGNEYYYYAGTQLNTDQTIKSARFVSTRVDDIGTVTTHGITIDTAGDTVTWQNVSSNVLTDTVTSKKYTFEVTNAKLILKEVT